MGNCCENNNSYKNDEIESSDAPTKKEKSLL
jgi:hypothetical protein